MKYSVISDFDGTITKIDVGDFLLVHFKLISKKEIEKSYILNLPVEKWMRDNFTLISNIPKREIFKAINKYIEIKKGFKEFLSYAKKKKIPFEIVSGGVDLYADAVFKKYNIKAKSYFGKFIENSGKAVIKYDFLKKSKELSDFKKERVLYYKNRGYKTIYCGDAPNDLKAADSADIVFADKRLYKIGKDKGYIKLNDFRKLIDFLKN